MATNNLEHANNDSLPLATGTQLASDSVTSLSRRSSRRASISRNKTLSQQDTNNSDPATAATFKEDFGEVPSSLELPEKRYVPLKGGGDAEPTAPTLLQKIKKTKDKSASSSLIRRKSASASALISDSGKTDAATASSDEKKSRKPQTLKLNISNSSLKDLMNDGSSSDINKEVASNTKMNDIVSDSNMPVRKPSKKKSKSGSDLSISKKKKKERNDIGSPSMDELASPLKSALSSSIPKSAKNDDPGLKIGEMERRLDEITSDALKKVRLGGETAGESTDESGVAKSKKKKKSKKSAKTKSHAENFIGKPNTKESSSAQDEASKQPASTSSSAESLENSYENSIVSLHIFKTDSLISEMNLKHPLVQIHVLDVNTGLYWSKSDHGRLVTSAREPANITYILPTITKTFDMIAHETKTPLWNQKIVLNEKYIHIADPKVIIFFEILDFVNNLKAIRRYPDGWNRIAWGFLKPIGSDGKPTTNQEVRLQLYKYPWRLFPFSPRKLPIPFVYTCYKQPWRKYASTLYVKVGAHKTIDATTILDRPTLPTETESGKVSLDHLLGKMKLMNNQDNGMKNLISISSIKPKWRRKAGDACKLPNRLLYRIDAGQKGSFSCCFSKNGYLLAIAGVNQNSYPIKIYKIDTGERIATLEGHQDLIYQLNWANDDSQLISASSDGSTRIWSFAADGSVRQSSILLHPTFVYTTIYHPTQENPRVVVTGAYDGLIRFWTSNPNAGIQQTNTPDLKLAGHKSNVNSICFDSDGTRMYSGDGSGLIKIWSSETADAQQKSVLHYECIKTVDALKGHPIQALRMHPSNRKLMAQTIGPNLHMLDTRIHRILTHFQLPSEKKFELESALPAAQSYPKLFNAIVNDVTTAKQQLNSIHQISSARFLKCSFSACGTFVFVGSTNGSVHFWRSESGAYLGTYNNQALTSWAQGNYPIVDISFHPHDHMIAFAIWGDKEPVRVYTWDKKQPDIKMQAEEVAEAASATEKRKHLNVDKLVSNSMRDLFGDYPLAIKTRKNWIKSPTNDVPSDMVALISPSSL